MRRPQKINVLAVAVATVFTGVPVAAAESQGEAPATTRLSQIVGATVLSSDDEAVGVVDEAMLDPSGTLSTLVIGLAGSLGAGEKDVALPFADTQIGLSRPLPSSAVFRDGNSYGSGPLRVHLRLSTRDLLAAPPFVLSQKPKTGVPSSSSGQPESITKEPESSTQSGGPG